MNPQDEWDDISSFLKVLKDTKEKRWFWYLNTRCKYVDLRIDMRDGHCIMKDRHGVKITPEELAYQIEAEE